jgi:hypothetical protein
MRTLKVFVLSRGARSENFENLEIFRHYNQTKKGKQMCYNSQHHVSIELNGYVSTHNNCLLEA